MTPFGIQAPQQVQATPGVQGGVVGTNPTVANRDPHADQVVKGLTQLMSGFVGMKQATEQHYGDKLDKKMVELSNGLDPNPDWNEIMKWAKRSGRGYKTDITPGEAQFQKQNYQVTQYQDAVAQAQQQAQALASQSSGMVPQAPGPSGSPGQLGAAAPGVQALPPASSGAPPGFVDKLRQFMGMKATNPNMPQTSQDSPFGQQLQALGQAGQVGGGMPGQVARQGAQSVLGANVAQAAGKLGIAHDQAMAPVYSQVFHQALGDPSDPQTTAANTMLRRLDVFKGVPVDEVADLYTKERPGISPATANQKAAQLLLWQQGGGPALQLKMGDLAKDMIPRFGGDAQKSMSYVMGLYSGQDTGLRPGLTAEEVDKKTSAEDKMFKELPNAPMNLIQMYGDAKMSGQSKLADNLSEFLTSHYKTSGEVAQGQYGSTLANEKNQFQQKLKQDYTQIASQNAIGNDRNDAEMFSHYTKALDQLSEDSRAILKNPKEYTPDQLDKAKDELSDIHNKLAGTKVKLRDGETQLAPLEEILARHGNWNPLTRGPFLAGNAIPTSGSATSRQTPLESIPGMTPGNPAVLPGNPQNRSLQQLLLQRSR